MGIEKVEHEFDLGYDLEKFSMVRASLIVIRT